MKYKVGDQVKIKSLDWYNENKDEDGEIVLNGEFVFLEDMKKFCSETLTILEDVDDGYLMLEDDLGYVWTDEMFERLVERNGKTYPYKIGDRVVLKGNNRCATITDLKYNSWGNLSYYIKIDNDKDISTDYPTELLLPYDNKIKGFLEDETIPKFKVGDKVITDTNMKGKIIEVIEKGWYRVEFEPHNNIPQPNGVVPEENMLLVEEKCNYVQVNNIPDITQAKTSSACSHNGFYGYSDSDGNETSEWNLPEGYQFIDENGNVIHATKIVLEKKKKEYPKTYEECCRVLNTDDDSIIDISVPLHYNHLLISFTQLLICRDAYWKIAGEEMGLGKPWAPDWNNISDKYCIYFVSGDVWSKECQTRQCPFAFPTPEMRDAFKENFDPDIESCKEFL